MFVASIHFPPSLIFVGKAGAYQRVALYVTPFSPCLAHKYYTRIEANGRKNTLAYYYMVTITDEEEVALVANVIKLFRASLG